MANLQKSKYFLQNLDIKQKMCKKIAQMATNYTFLRSTCLNKFKCAKHLQNFETFVFNQVYIDQLHLISKITNSENKSRGIEF